LPEENERQDIDELISFMKPENQLSFFRKNQAMKDILSKELKNV
jgi:predicted nucleotidyltransferase